MRSTLAALFVFLLLPGAIAAPDPATSAPTPSENFPGVDTAAAAPAETLPADPNVVAVRPRAVLHWWDDPAFDRRINLVLKDADLNTAIDTLGRSANMSLIASGGSKARKKVTLNLRNAPLRDVMLAVANLYGLLWFKTGEVYTLTYVSTAGRSGRTTGGTRLTPPAPPVRRPVIVVPEKRPTPKPSSPAAGRGLGKDTPHSGNQP